MNTRNGGEILLSVELELPKAGRGASALHRPKGESRAEKKAKNETSSFRSEYSSYAEGMKDSADDAKRTAKKANNSPRSPRAKLKDKLRKAYDKFIDDRSQVTGKNVASLLRKVTPLGHPSAKQLDISKWIRKNGMSLTDELSFYKFENLYESFFPAKSGSNKPSSAGRPDSSSKGKRPGTSRFAASKRSAWKIGAKCIYKNKYTVKISRINADKTFNISYQEGRYKGKIMEGVEKKRPGVR